MASKERLFLIQTSAMCDFKIERDYHSNPHLFKTLRTAERIPPNNATIRLEIHAPFPTEEELRLELDRERKMIEAIQTDESEANNANKVKSNLPHPIDDVLNRLRVVCYASNVDRHPKGAIFPMCWEVVE